MFSFRIINSAKFLKMPIDAQLLYFHLGIRADDDGVVEAYSAMKLVGSSDDNLKVLVAKGFVEVLNDDLVVFIVDFYEHNKIRADRKVDSIYKGLLEDNNIKTIEPKPRSDVKDNSRRLGGQSTDSIGKVRLGKVKLSKSNTIATEKSVAGVNDIFEIFYNINPLIRFGNKTSRKSAEILIKKFGLDGTKKMAEQIIGVQGKKYAPSCTTPYQMEEKLAQFKIYFDKEKDNKPKVAIIK